MPECDRCESSQELLYSCNYCNGQYCSDHRLPESHQCLGLRKKSSSTKPLESGGPSTDRRSTKRQRREGVRKKETKKTDYRGWTPEGWERKKPRKTTHKTGTDSKKTDHRDHIPDDRRPAAATSSRKAGSDAGHRYSKPNSEPEGLSLTSIPNRVVAWAIFVFFWPLRALWNNPVSIMGIALLFVASVGLGFIPADVVLPDQYASDVESVVDWVEHPPDSTNGGEDSSDAGGTAGAGVTNTPTDTPEPTAAQGLSRERVEEQIHVKINVERSEAGLSNLSFDSQLVEIARYHSEDMAERDYFAHESPEGEDFSDRYNQHGYECKVPAGGNTYYTGAENIAYTYYQEPLVGGDYHDSPKELAEGVVQQWMDSPGHRRNILTEEWRNEGIGVSITETSEGTRVYVTQNFC